ncbi:MAG: hypothetical protein CME70_14875 [Halobacteriovorax sp.]|nr:hypothetical protein [Halobacteriovorax sp.]|tara:strand:+ start:154916 stop:156817 length:1902 start_codon:yes stop_codon:yes gene_type:complete
MKKFIFLFLCLLWHPSILFSKTNFCTVAKDCKSRFYSKDNFLTYYSTHDLKSSSTEVNRLVIVVHGALRNGDTYFNDTVLAAQKHSSLNKLIVLAPHFRKITDKRELGEHYWGRRWYTKWKYGYKSEDSDKVSSFTIIDNLIKSIVSSNNFPNLKTIVITGHSAGGQFTQRFAVANKLREEVEQKIKFVPSNPSSYMYLHDKRYEFAEGNYRVKNIGSACKEYNHYIYGPIDRADYMSGFSLEELRSNFSDQDIVYLMSEEDKGTDSLDRSCEANLQGKNRFERSLNFFYYAKKSFKPLNHRFLSIPKIGHEHVHVYESKEAGRVIFGKNEKLSSYYSYRKIGTVKDRKLINKKSFTMFGGGKNEPLGMKRFLSKVKGGNLLVISGKDILNHRYTHDFWRMAEEFEVPLASVETFSFHHKKAGDTKELLELLKRADGVFFTGGDQSKYILRIKGTKFHRELLKRNLPIAGTSAGLAIMGEYIFSAKFGGLRSSTVLKRPHSKYISIEKDFFYSPLIGSVITDTHFSNRDREGRLLGFMFKAQFDFGLSSVFGIGVDEHTSLHITHDQKMTSYGVGSVWLYKSLDSKVIEQEGPLNYGPISFYKLKKNKPYPHYKILETNSWSVLQVVNGVVSK